MTVLSRFWSIALIVAIAGCSGHQVTSVEGEIRCESLTCGDGQLCKAFEPHPGEPEQYSCVSVEPSCEVFDCVSDDRGCSPDCDLCPSCITELCGYLTRVDGRNLVCLGF